MIIKPCLSYGDDFSFSRRLADKINVPGISGKISLMRMNSKGEAYEGIPQRNIKRPDKSFFLVPALDVYYGLYSGVNCPLYYSVPVGIERRVSEMRVSVYERVFLHISLLDLWKKRRAFLDFKA